MALLAVPPSAARAEGLRVALFHTELARDGPGLLLRDILKGEDAQIGAVVRVLRHVDADILVLADVDYDLGGHALGARPLDESTHAHLWAPLACQYSRSR